MKAFVRWIRISLVILFSLLIWPGAIVEARAAIAPSQQTPIEVQAHLGTSANELKFVPDNFTFETGKRYKLVLDNPSSQKHYFTAKDFADVIWTQKVDAGNVEIKGAVHELELRPGSHADWVFIALKPGTYELHCSVPGHSKAGMTGTITVSAS